MDVSTNRSEKEQERESSQLKSLNLPSLWAGFWRDHFSFWMICGYLFVEYVRPQSIVPEIDVLPWGKLFLALAVVGAFLDRSVRWVSDPLNTLISLFLIGIIFSISVANYPADASKHFVDFFSWYVIYFVCINIVHSPRRFVVFLFIFLLASFKISSGLATVFASRGFAFTTWGLSGPPGFFENSGELAIQMLVYWPIAYYLVVSWGKHLSWWKRILLWSMPVTAIVTIIGASSRGGQLALAVQLVFMLAIGKVRLSRIAIVLGLLYAGYLAIPEEGIDRFENVGSDTTSQQRLNYWARGLEMIREYPWLGVGYFNFEHYFQDFYAYDLLYAKAQMPHNIFIQIGTDGGLVLFSVYIALILQAFRTTARTRMALARGVSTKTFDAGLTRGFDVGFVGFLVAGQFVTVAYYPFMWIHLVFVVCLKNIVTKDLQAPRSQMPLDSTH